MEAIQVTYKGPPRAARLFVSYLEAEGATVEWEPPYEQRDLGSVAVGYTAGMLVWGTVEAIKAARAKLRERQPDAEVDWREGDAYR